MMRLERLLCALLAAGSMSAQVDVLTRHNDASRTGANLHETQLTPANVNKEHFGKLATRIVDGDIYAQPLIVSHAKIAGRKSPGTIALVATEHNSVYAFDADDVNKASTTALLWHTGNDVFGQPADAAKLGVDVGSAHCVDTTTEIGITSTPALMLKDKSSGKEGVVFVVSKSKSDAGYTTKLVSLDLASGAVVGETTIAGSVAGSGEGSVNGRIQFDPMYQMNRSALVLKGNTLFIAFGGHCDAVPYHGWVFAYDVKHAKSPKLLDVWSDTPDVVGKRESRAGIWMSGEGAPMDAEGNLYYVTGDGTYDGKRDFGDSVVKLRLDHGKFEVVDWFTPENQEYLKQHDVDLGSGGAILVPNSHALLAGGKEGRLYLVNYDAMGKGTVPSLQSFMVTHSHEMTPTMFYNLHGSGVLWPRSDVTYLYESGEENPITQFRLVKDDSTTGAGVKLDPEAPFKSSANCSKKPNCIAAPYPNYPGGTFGTPRKERVYMPGGFLTLSANGDKDGILWVSMPFGEDANHFTVRGILHALDASDVSKEELWNSEGTGDDNDRLGEFAKFNPPVVANGKVYVATFQEEIVKDYTIRTKATAGHPSALVIYGLK